MSAPILFEGNYSHESLVRRAMVAAGHNRPKAPRWVHVRDTFGTGSTMAGELCQAFGLDPHEEIGIEEEENE